MSKKPKTEYFQMRVDPILKKALRIFCERNFIDESGAIRMAVSQFPPIKKILDEEMALRKANKDETV